MKNIVKKKTVEPKFRCTRCGRIGSVGRCCGLDTREPLNYSARNELAAEAKRRKDDGK